MMRFLFERSDQILVSYIFPGDCPEINDVTSGRRFTPLFAIFCKLMTRSIIIAVRWSLFLSYAKMSQETHRLKITRPLSSLLNFLRIAALLYNTPEFKPSSNPITDGELLQRNYQAPSFSVSCWRASIADRFVPCAPW